MNVLRVFSGIALAVVLGVAGCGGGGGTGPGTSGSESRPATLEVRVTDITGMAIEGAMVKVTGVGGERQQSTDAQGVAEFGDLRSGESILSVSAVGFESATLEAETFIPGFNRRHVGLEAEGAWAVGRPIVLGTSLVSREADGSGITFSVDLAVMDQNLEAIQSLTSTDFYVQSYDCGWGPRDCASDGDGNFTGHFQAEGGAEAFELLTGASRHPYLAAVLVERSVDVCWRWDQTVAALESFFSVLGGNDMASLMSVQTETGSSTLTVHGPFTSDGRIYLDVLDGLGCSDTSSPVLLERLSEAIELVSAADGFGLPDAERHVVVQAAAGLTAREVEAVAEFARQTGVRISSVEGPGVSSGPGEAAVRSGGFVSIIRDGSRRDEGMVYAALDQALAGTLSFYRMQFSLVGDAGTFVPGGNAKVALHIDVPAAVPNRGTGAAVDVAIP